MNAEEPSQKDLTNYLSVTTKESLLPKNQDFIDNGMRCHVSGKITADLDQIDRKFLRFMSETSAYSYLAAEAAINHWFKIQGSNR